MKFRYRVKFTVDNMLLHSSQMKAGIVMNFITFLVFAIVVLINHTTGNFHKDTQAAFSEDISNVGYIYMDVEDYEENLNFIDALRSQDYISIAGSFSTYAMSGDDWDEISSKQSMNKRTYNEFSNANTYTEIIAINQNVFGLFDIRLKNGYEEAEEIYEKGYTPLYVGYQYKNMLHIGDVLSTKEEKYMVAGYIKRNQSMPIDSLVEIDKFSLHTTTSLDYGIVAVTEYEPDYWNVYFGVKDGYNFSDVKYRLRLLAEREKVDIRISNIASVVDAADASTKSIRKYLLDLFIIVAISSCVTLTCYQSMNILTRKYEYGILYANGFNETDMMFIIIMESLFKMIISIMLVIPILAIIAKKFFETIYESQRILNKIIYQDVLSAIILAGLIITAVSSIFPIILIKKNSASELIGDKI